MMTCSPPTHRLPLGQRHGWRAVLTAGLLWATSTVPALADHAQRFTRGPAAVDATYRYDALGRRIEKIVDDGAVQTTRFYYSGWQVVEEQDGADVTEATYAYGNYIDEPVNMERATEGSYLHCDDNFNVTMSSDEVATPIERYRYGDHGQTSILDLDGNPIDESIVGNSYLFTGRRADTESSLYWYRTRHHEPMSGRFIQRDTIGAWGDSVNVGNPVAYVNNAAYSQTDPWGDKPGHRKARTRRHVRPRSKRDIPESEVDIVHKEILEIDARLGVFTKDVLAQEGIEKTTMVTNVYYRHRLNGWSACDARQHALYLYELNMKSVVAKSHWLGKRYHKIIEHLKKTNPWKMRRCKKVYKMEIRALMQNDCCSNSGYQTLRNKYRYLCF